MFPRNQVVIVFLFSFLRKRTTKQTFKDAISNIMYTLLWTGVLPGKVCFEAGDPQDGYNDFYTQVGWEKSTVKQFSKASGLNLQGNHS